VIRLLRPFDPKEGAATETEGEIVEFTSNGTASRGFLASPEGDGPFAGVVVVQEWWGLDDHIKDVAQRFAREGFVAFAPDLYHGEVASEPGEAQKLMMALDMNRASRELVQATEYLASQPALNGRGIGSIGFCMGGGRPSRLPVTALTYALPRLSTAPIPTPSIRCGT